METCPVCKRKRVRVNERTYSFARYRCDYCKCEWHSCKGLDEASRSMYPKAENYDPSRNIYPAHFPLSRS